MVWLVVLGFGVLLIPVEYFLGTNSGGNSLLPFPWFVPTLSSFFVVGGLCAFITTRRLESRRVVDFLLRGGLNGLYTGLFNILLVLVFLLISGIYNIYHSEHLAPARMELRPTWGLLVLVLLVFLIAGCFHAIAACLGGMLGGAVQRMDRQNWCGQSR
jgi:hypothetical protein